MAASHHLGFGPTGNSAVRSDNLKNPTLEPNISWSDDPWRRYGHMKFSKVRGRPVIGRLPVINYMYLLNWTMMAWSS